LDVGVLVPDVQIAACRRILRDARRLQEDLVERRIHALRQVVDRGLVDFVAVSADACENGLTLLIELFGLIEHCLARRERRLCRRRRGYVQLRQPFLRRHCSGIRKGQGEHAADKHENKTHRPLRTLDM
jgi:hypothetical protein